VRNIWYRIPLWVRVVGGAAAAVVLWPVALIVGPFVLVGWWQRQLGHSAWNALWLLVPILGLVYLVQAIWYAGKHGFTPRVETDKEQTT